MSITTEAPVAPLDPFIITDTTVPAPQEEIDMRPEVADWTVVKVYKVVDGDAHMITRNGERRDLKADPLIGQVTRAYTKDHPRTWPLVEVYIDGYGTYRFNAKEWEIIEPVQRPEVADGDHVLALAGPNLPDYAATYLLDEPVPVVDKSYRGITVRAIHKEDGVTADVSLRSWKKVEEAEEPTRPKTQIGTKIRVKAIYPTRLMEDGSLGDGIGIVSRVRPDRTNGRIIAAFRGANGDYVTRPVHSWEIVPFESDRDELECFKIGLWWMTMAYGQENNLCTVLTKALQEANVVPKRTVKVELEVDLHAGTDLRNAPTLASLDGVRLMSFLQSNGADVVEKFTIVPKAA